MELQYLKPTNIAPLDFNKAITGNMNIDYRFPADTESPILREFGVAALFTFDSGHPFTLGTGKGDANGSLEEITDLDLLLKH